eukprot:4473400-Pleurochrysis_carterae.AAC.1
MEQRFANETSTLRFEHGLCTRLLNVLQQRITCRRFACVQTHEFQAEPLDQLTFSRGEGVALVFGNERRGVSRAFLEHADSAPRPRSIEERVSLRGTVVDGATAASLSTDSLSSNTRQQSHACVG